MKLFTKYKFGIALMLIFIFALTIRITRYCLDSRVEKDAVLYINMAKDWNTKGKQHAFDRNPRIPPLYIYLMMVGEKAGIGAESTGASISIIVSSLTALSIFLMASALMDKKLALLAAFLAAIHPVFIRMSPEVMRDSLYIFCFSSSLAFFVHGIVYKKKYFWGIAGFFATMATLTRSEGAELIFIPFLWLIVEIFMELKEKEKKDQKENFVSSVIFSSKSVLKKYMPGLITAVVIFSICSFPVQAAFKNTSSTWTVFDHRIMGYLDSMVP